MGEITLSDDLLRADLRLRHLTLAVFGVAVVIALLGMFVFQRWLGGIASMQGTDLAIMRLRGMIAIALTGIAICLALLAWLSAHKAAKTLKTQQWPLPGARVIRDTTILRGDAASRLGRLLQISAVVLLLLAFATGFVSWRLLMLS